MQKTISVINLPAIKRNALKVRSLLKNGKFFAVVKADAYGHGAEEVSRYIESVCDCFCVAIIEEGISLRVAGVQKPVLVFTPPLDSYDVERAKFYNLILSVNSLNTAKLIGGLPCHIQINTGMNRSGCNISELDGIIDFLGEEQITGVYSHLYAPENDAASLKQLEIFDVAERIVKAKSPNAVAHLSASGGILRGGKFLKDGGRSGILLYGYAPHGFDRSDFEPALKVYARRTQVTKFIGGGVGYNLADKNYGELSCYRLGYADGFSRTVPLGEKTLCMDAFLSEKGEETFLAMSDADEYAKRANTISYEVLTNVTRRSERIYLR